MRGIINRQAIQTSFVKKLRCMNLFLSNYGNSKKMIRL